MVQLSHKFHVDDPSLQSSARLIPPGTYKAVIVQSELKENSKKNGHFIAMTVVVTEGEHQNMEFIERLNIINQNDTAVKIAYKTLADISKAVGMTETPDNTEALHNKPFLIQVETEAGKPYMKTDPTSGIEVEAQGQDQSRIKKYLAVGSMNPAPQQTSFTPQNGLSGAGATPVATTDAPQAPAAGSKPPWAS